MDTIEPKVPGCNGCRFEDKNYIPSPSMPNTRRCGWLKIIMPEDGYCSYAKVIEEKEEHEDDVITGDGHE